MTEFGVLALTSGVLLLIHTILWSQWPESSPLSRWRRRLVLEGHWAYEVALVGYAVSLVCSGVMGILFSVLALVAA